ncbi:Flp family type IVb pilin [Variovorax sp. Varisp41]|uniref:Flp family type IVb pilin n=1 Tax=unclassified Variovorax TaxID=663243 RepID=UPI0039B416F5
MLNAIARFIRDEEGATAIEYGLIAGLISVAIVAVLPGIGDKLEVVFTKISTALTGPGTP